MKFEYLLPKTRSFLFALANAYESSGGDVWAYHEKIYPILKQYGNAADEYADTLARLHYLNDASLLIPTEAGLHYQKLRRIYLADRFVRPAIVSFITTIATMAATYIAANVSPWFRGLLEAIQSIFQ